MLLSLAFEVEAEIAEVAEAAEGFARMGRSAMEMLYDR
jgi:hypothetical protein